MKNKMQIPAIFGIVCGLSMFAQWTMFILTGQVPELQTEPLRIAFHLAAEGLTAVSLILSGVWLLQKKGIGKKLYPIAAGMLIYSVIVSPGYFAELGQWSLVVMFMGLLVLAIISLVILFRAE